MCILCVCADSRFCKGEVIRKGSKFNGFKLFVFIVSQKKHLLLETVKINCFCNKTNGFVRKTHFTSQTFHVGTQEPQVVPKIEANKIKH